jgi:hypothetical protein
MDLVIGYPSFGDSKKGVNPSPMKDRLDLRQQEAPCQNMDSTALALTLREKPRYIRGFSRFYGYARLNDLT